MRIEYTHDTGVCELRHHSRAANESFATLRVAGEMQVKHLDRDTPLAAAIMSLPYHGEPAAAELLDQQVAAVAQPISGAKLSAITQLSRRGHQAHPLTVDRSDGRV
ncbi:MAG TPA: hypothetical protein VGD37_27165 [Kofleriaceae bacterium]|jgi:hypothetical protein